MASASTLATFMRGKGPVGVHRAISTWRVRSLTRMPTRSSPRSAEVPTKRSALATALGSFWCLGGSRRQRSTGTTRASSERACMPSSMPCSEETAASSTLLR